MPTSLEAPHSKLKQRLSLIEGGLTRHLVSPSVKKRDDVFAIQEGYVSSLWQAWCQFCRDLLITSAQGASTRSGSITTSPYAPNSEMEIAYVAYKLSRREAVGNIRALSGSHKEHTWGDISKLNDVAVGLGISNLNAVLTGLSVCLSLRDLQLCRNSSAHLTRSTISDVRSARVRYTDTRLRHPSDMISWVDPQSGDYLWRAWIDEMQIASDFAVQ